MVGSPTSWQKGQAPSVQDVINLVEAKRKFKEAVAADDKPSMSAKTASTAKQAAPKVKTAQKSEPPSEAEKLQKQLLNKLAEKTGVDTSGKNTDEIGKAVEDILLHMKETLPDGYSVWMSETEKEFGLDKAGISLDDSIKAFIDPESEEARQVKENLAHLADKPNQDQTTTDTAAQDSVIQDPVIGTYQPKNYPYR